MPFTDAALQAATTGPGILVAFPYVALHSADPGSTGANETSAARVKPTWPTATGSGDSSVSNVPFTGGAAGGAVTYFGLWSAQTGGVFGGGFAFAAGSDTTFNAAGAYTATTLTVDLTAT